METINATEIWNELYEFAKSIKDEELKLKAYSIVLSELKSLSYQDVMHNALNEMVNSFRKL